MHASLQSYLPTSSRLAKILECGDWSPLFLRATCRPVRQDKSRRPKAPTSRRSPGQFGCGSAALRLCLVSLALCFLHAGAFAAPVPLADGKTFAGWLGDTNKTWRIEAGAFVGGSLTQPVPRNEFLRTTRSYTNFVLRLKFKLVGSGSFINAGVQVRSQPATNPPNEMVGYQADLGEGYWGALYDESRRNKILAQPAAEAVKQALKPGDWNDYEIRCEGRRIRTFINGQPMADFTETDEAIPQWGVIGLQIHGGGPAQVSYREITLEELP